MTQSIDPDAFLFFQSKVQWIAKNLIHRIYEGESFQNGNLSRSEGWPSLRGVPLFVFLQSLKETLFGGKFLNKDTSNNINGNGDNDDHNIIKFQLLKNEEPDGVLLKIIGKARFYCAIKPKAKKKRKRRTSILEDDLVSMEEDEDSQRIPEICNWIPSKGKAEQSFSEDRRNNKNRLRIVEFNAEWLYLHGGKGALKCPGSQCPWKVNKMDTNEIG